MVIHFMVSQYVSYKVVVGGGGVYVASIFILRNPDTLLPHLYSCLAIRYTTIPYQKSAQPPWIPRKVILVMLPPWRLSLSLSLSLSVSLISSLSYCILCSISSLERTQLGRVGEVSPFYWEFLWHVVWHETKITFLLGIVSRTHYKRVYKVAISWAEKVFRSVCGNWKLDSFIIQLAEE